MVLSRSEYEFKERIHEMRLWTPTTRPRFSELKLVGRPVHVRWQTPVFERDRAAYTDRGVEVTWRAKWFGYVEELGRLVPGEELAQHPPKEAK